MSERGRPSGSAGSEGDEAELLDGLSRYLKCASISPPGDTTAAVAVLAEILRRHGIEPTILEPFPRKPILVARLPGRAPDGGLVYLGHSDVVAVGSGWTVEPFSGEIRDGFVWGRGALDMKTMTIMQLWALLRVRRAAPELARELTLVVVPDEEQGGYEGAEWLAANRPDLCRGRWVLNEGGMGVQLADRGELVFICSVGEKGPLWLELTARGPSGHSAIPHGGNSLEILTAGLGRLLARDIRLEIGPHQQALLDYLGLRPSTPADLPPRLYLRAQLNDTISLTMLEAGVKQNVIPESARAVLDCRLLPGTDPEAFMARVRALLGDGRIAMRVLVRRDASGSDPADPFVGELRDALHNEYGPARFFPYYAPYFTDSLFFRKLGLAAYGLMPFRLEETDLDRIHGVDERISVENVLRGTRVLTDLALRMCAGRAG